MIEIDYILTKLKEDTKDNPKLIAKYYDGKYAGLINDPDEEKTKSDKQLIIALLEELKKYRTAAEKIAILIENTSEPGKKDGLMLAEEIILKQLLEKKEGLN